jgi:GxxExxY protein
MVLFGSPQLIRLTGEVIAAAMKVHTALGPGLLESAYRACLAVELRLRGLGVECEVPVSILYAGVTVEACYRIDILVDRTVVVELKAVEKLMPIHEAQLLSHLRLGDFRAGLLINFNVEHLRDGIRRVVNRA